MQRCRVQTGISATRIGTYDDTATYVLRTVVLGTLKVHVKYEAQRAALSVLVSGPSLLGRDWLKRLQLNWKEMAAVTSVLAICRGNP